MIELFKESRQKIIVTDIVVDYDQTPGEAACLFPRNADSIPAYPTSLWNCGKSGTEIIPAIYLIRPSGERYNRLSTSESRIFLESNRLKPLAPVELAALSRIRRDLVPLIDDMNIAALGRDSDTYYLDPRGVYRFVMLRISTKEYMDGIDLYDISATNNMWLAGQI